MFVLIAKLPDYRFEDEDEAQDLQELQLVAKAETKDELAAIQAMQEEATANYWNSISQLGLANPLKNAKEMGITTAEDYNAYVNKWNADLKDRKAEIAQPQFLDCNFFIF